MKFGRQYQLSIEVKPDAQNITTSNVVLELPFTVEFEVNRDNSPSAQTGTFKILNLSAKTRNLLFKDPWNTAEFRAIQFRAGYNGVLSLLFNGTVKSCVSYRDSGSTEFVTEIEAYDGAYGMMNGDTSKTFVGGTTAKQIIQELNNNLPGTSSTPVVGNWPAVTARGSVYSGNTWKHIYALTNGLAVIDNGQLKCLQENEVIEAEIPVINSDSGLLGSPRRSEQAIEVDMIFEPRLTLSQLVYLESTVNPQLNGPYKVMGIHHQGTISDAVCGDAKTTVKLWTGTAALTTVVSNHEQ
jgi:hypothetical protein